MNTTERDYYEVLGIPRDVEVKVPKGAQPDEVLRLRGKGLPRPGGLSRGDLKLRIQVHIPEAGTAKERKLFEQLRALHRRDSKIVE